MTKITFHQLQELAKTAKGKRQICVMVAAALGIKIRQHTRLHPRPKTVTNCPDYTGSLDAIAAAVKASPLDKDRWAQWLFLIVKGVEVNEWDRLKDFHGELGNICRFDLAPLLGATPTEWAIAFIVTYQEQLP